MPRGRPTDLTPEIQESITRDLTLGLDTVEDICSRAGISVAAYYAWRDKGRKKTRQIYVDFEEACAKATATFKAGRLARIVQAGVGGETTTRTTKKYGPDGKLVEETTIETTHPASWQANAWLLERKFPREFAKATRFEVIANDEPEETERDDIETARADVLDFLSRLRDRESKDRSRAGARASNNGG